MPAGASKVVVTPNLDYPHGNCFYPTPLKWNISFDLTAEPLAGVHSRITNILPSSMAAAASSCLAVGIRVQQSIVNGGVMLAIAPPRQFN